MSVGTIKLDGSDVEANPALVRWRTRLQKLDANKDGEIELSELCFALEEMASMEKQRKLLKWVAIITAAFTLLSIAAIVGLTFAVVNLSKDTQLVDGKLVPKGSTDGTPVITSSSIKVSDISNLYRYSLDDLHSLQYITVTNGDGSGRILKVAELSLIPNVSATITSPAGTKITVDAAGLHEESAGGARRLLTGVNGQTGQNCDTTKTVTVCNYTDDGVFLGCDEITVPDCQACYYDDCNGAEGDSLKQCLNNPNRCRS